MIMHYHDINKAKMHSSRSQKTSISARFPVITKARRNEWRKKRPGSTTMNAVKSVDRALAILESFEESSPFLTAQEIASRVGIPRPSVYRFLKTLCEKNFLVEVGETESRRFAVGSSLLRLAKLAFGQGELRRIAQPIMRLAADKSNESTYLSVRHVSQAVCIENFDAQAPLRYGGRVGNTYPLYAGSPKVILAFLDPDLRDHLINETALQPITKATVTNRDELRRRLTAIRRRGFEISNGEIFPGTCAIGAPVFDENDAVIAVLSIGAPRDRVTAKNRDQLVDIVRQSAQAITMNYRRQIA
jgi:IclR family transcriptional regulator, KDG regulon repressor